MAYLLNVIYLALVAALSPWFVYQALTKQKYRAGFAEKFLGRVPRRSSQRPCVWLHAVSVGEVNLLASLLSEFERSFPSVDCVISTTTLTGYQLAKKKYASQLVFYCPLDFSWAVRAAMRRLQPRLLVLAELELWPNLIRAAREQGARVAVINGRLSEHSFRGYRRVRPFIARLLQGVDLIAAQDQTYATRFLALGASPRAVVVTGSMKYDGAQTDRANAATCRLAKLAGIAPDDIVFLAGSTGEPEEALALATFRELSPRYPQLRLILVPRHPERFAAVASLLSASGIPYSRRTTLTDGPAERVLLVDAVGELGAWWGTAQIAFVGGSLCARGGQNMIEPAAYGAAVSFGPNTRNFRDIVASLLDRQGAMVVQDGAELTAFVRRAIDDPLFAAQLGGRAQQLIRESVGATARTVALLAQLLEGHALVEHAATGPAPTSVPRRRVA